MSLDPPDRESPHVLLEGRFAATPEGVREALAAATDRLRAAGGAGEEVFGAELVIAEALNNIVEHAMTGVEAPAFALCLARGANGIEVEITDRGRGMPDGRPPIGRAPVVPRTMEELPEGGFGWFIIRELARDLRYSRSGGENRLTFRLAICVTAAA